MKNRGFTLIELLVVIAIIGILSSVVLASLNNARNKANDAKVKTQLSEARVAADSYYSTNYNYGLTTNSCSSSMFADSASGMDQYTLPANVVKNYPTNTQVVCGATESPSAYAIKATLNNGGVASYWCVDSVGRSIMKVGAIGASTSFCPP